MQPKNSQPPPATPAVQFKLSDVYYVLFKHKWLILISTLLGIGTATFYFVTTPAMFQSEAKLMVRYVKDTKAPTGLEESNERVQRVAADVMLSEAEILTSLDVATNVVQQIG